MDATAYKLQARFWDVDDFTTYLDKDGIENKCSPVTALLLGKGISHSGQVDVHQDIRDVNNKTAYAVQGRGLICSCFDGSRWSITVRKQAVVPPPDDPYVTRKVPYTQSRYAPDGRANPKFPLSFQTTCSALYPLVFQPGDNHPHGVVVIAGGTGAGKSQITRGLIYMHLQSVLRSRDAELMSRDPNSRDPEGRRPHLLTLEDPIEASYFDTICPSFAQSRGIDYTPRVIGVDTACLSDAFGDALRQTPSVVYIGEIRNVQDWKAVLDFSGTGHLVVTTTHAGSLIEAMDRIFRAVAADTPARRGQVAETLLAVIHLQPALLNNQSQSITLPAIWRRTPAGVAAMVADGFASVLPANSNGTANSSIGRLGFAFQFEDYECCRFKSLSQGRIRQLSVFLKPELRSPRAGQRRLRLRNEKVSEYIYHRLDADAKCLISVSPWSPLPSSDDLKFNDNSKDLISLCKKGECVRCKVVQNFSSHPIATLLSERGRKRYISFIEKMTNPNDPRAQINAWAEYRREVLLQEINSLLWDREFYDKARFAGILTNEHNDEIQALRRSGHWHRLNRKLLSLTYPTVFEGFDTKAVSAPDNPDLWTELKCWAVDHDLKGC